MKSPGLFITGTNTEVGKTFITSGIARVLTAAGRRVGIYKPAASGCVQRNGEWICSDAIALWEAAGQPLSVADVCPQSFIAPIAPHLAARQEGREIDAELLRTGLDRWRDFDLVLVEGAGGLMSPLGDDEYVADLAVDIGYPLIIVAANTLGVINQTLQTLVTAATFRDGLGVAGVILNDVSPQNETDMSRQSNLRELRSRCGAPILAHVGHNDTTSLNSVDWMSLVRS